ncbi:snodprot1 [Coprinopsis sp. MPI-PUGE-AT-0042]|nr:snodprot1 [Coprinopsis sp. MPI-PUGE-AT-0042]
MKLLSLSTLLLFPFLAAAEDLTYDPWYANGREPLTSSYCSDGVNGLITKYGYSTFQEIPSYPRIGSAPAVTDVDSVGCGTCWQLTYTDGGSRKSINITAIDWAPPNVFTTSQRAMDELTNGQALNLRTVGVTVKQIPAKSCGLPFSLLR